jgi:hypothetical protein
MAPHFGGPNEPSRTSSAARVPPEAYVGPAHIPGPSGGHSCVAELCIVEPQQRLLGENKLNRAILPLVVCTFVNCTAEAQAPDQARLLSGPSVRTAPPPDGVGDHSVHIQSLALSLYGVCFQDPGTIASLDPRHPIQRVRTASADEGSRIKGGEEALNGTRV